MNSGGNNHQQQCSLSAHELGEHFRASSYGEKRGIFNAFFAPGSEEDPRCRICDRSIHQHNASSQQHSARQQDKTNSGSSHEPNHQQPNNANPFEMAAIPMATAVADGAVALPGGWGSCAEGLMNEDEFDDAKPDFRPYPDDDAFVRRRVPPHWKEDSSRLWRQIGKGSDAYHACNIRGCPEDPTKITDIRVHMRSVHGIMTVEPEQEMKKRQWNAPFCPTDDCGALCDCLWCCPCFLIRLTNMNSSCSGCMHMALEEPDENNKVESSGYRIQTRYGDHARPGDPHGCPCGPATCLFCWHFWGWVMMSLSSACTIPHPYFTMLGACTGRQQFVMLERIEDDGCCVHCMAAHCCYPCVLVQMHRELRSIGRDPGTTCCSTRPEHIAPSDYQHDLRPSWQSIVDANRATIKME